MAYTDGDSWQEGPGIDEYFALTKFIGMQPAIGVRLQWGTAEEVQEATELVEYCNGSPDTRMGALRASRGHQAPHNISVIYLGNEIGVQNRFSIPNKAFPDNIGGPASAAEYGAILKQFIPALLAIDPKLKLVAANGCPNISQAPDLFPGIVAGNIYFREPWLRQAAFSWSGPVIRAAGMKLFAHSYHYYSKAIVHWDQRAATNAAKSARELIQGLYRFRQELDRGVENNGLPPQRISLDEWGAIGPPWVIEVVGSVHAIYTASVFALLLKEFQKLKLAAANYYAPVNEGGIAVGPHETTLTAIGLVIQMYSRHQGQRLLRGVLAELDGHPYDTDDLLVTVSIDPGQSQVLLTVVNRNAVAPRELHLEGETMGVESTDLWRLPVSLLETHFMTDYMGDVGKLVPQQTTLGNLQKTVSKGKGSRHSESSHRSIVMIPPFTIMQVVLPVRGAS